SLPSRIPLGLRRAVLSGGGGRTQGRDWEDRGGGRPGRRRARALADALRRGRGHARAGRSRLVQGTGSRAGRRAQVCYCLVAAGPQGQVLPHGIGMVLCLLSSCVLLPGARYLIEQ
ncbi:unnamed protein product, partial [Urochloa humidicola]